MREFHQYQVQLKLDGTCAWIWTDSTFERWRNSTASTASDRLLCIQGTQGCGKTVLASSLVEGLAYQQQRILSFSFTAIDDDRQKIDDCVRVLLWQLLEQVDNSKSWDLVHCLMSQGQRLTSELWDAMDTIVAELTDPLVLVLDGIDESTEPLQPLFNRLHQLLYVQLNLRAILLGRPYAFKELQSRFSSMPWTIEITPSLNRNDVDAFIRAEMAKSAVLRLPELQNTIFNLLARKSDGMFLWVRLMIDGLQRSATKAEIVERLHNIPRGLDKAYSQVFSQLVKNLDHFELQLARNVLSFAVVACRPLELEEIRYAHALATMPCSAPRLYNIEDYLLLDSRQKIINVCKGLVSFHNSKLHLIHSSLREFLVKSESEWRREDSRHIIGFRVDESQTHRLLGFICLEYLKRGPYSFNLQSLDSLLQLRAHHPLLDYASRFAFRHLNSAGTKDSEFIDKLKGFLQSTEFPTWVDHFTSQLVDKESFDLEPVDFMNFLDWASEGDHTRELSAILKISIESELADRIRKFGETDPRTLHWGYVLEFVQAGGFFEQSEHLDKEQSRGGHQVHECKGSLDPSNAVDQIIQMLSSASIAQLDKRITTLLRLSTWLQKVQTMTDALKILFRLIIQKAYIIPAWGLLAIGGFYSSLEKDNEALEIYATALARVDSKETELKYLLCWEIGQTHFSLGQYHQALSYYQRALYGFERLLGGYHIDTLTAKARVAISLVDFEQFDEAREHYSSLLVVQQRFLEQCNKKPRHGLYHLARLALTFKEYEKALELSQKAAIGYERLLGQHHSATLNAKAAIGYVFLDLNQLVEAEECFSNLLTIQQQQLGLDNKRTLKTLDDLAFVNSRLRRYEKALQLDKR